MLKNWKQKQVDENEVESLFNSLKIHKSICQILIARGITTIEESKQYFRPLLSDIIDPIKMKGMQKAVDRIIYAFQNNQKILLYGDYDVDGTTAVAVVFNFIKHFHDNIDFYIPNRFSEGYGVSAAGMDYAVKNKVELLITLDCGIKSVSHVDMANENNIDVIICDHHMPEELVPNALAILNPKQIDCPYPYKELCGCGIGYKLICALEQTMLGEQNICNQYLDLVATAIAADIVSMTGENRILAYYGLKKANENPCIAIQALKIAGDLKTAFTIADLVFIVAPRVNAAGRMDDAKLAVQLFLSNDLIAANEIAAKININNDDRKDTDKQMTAEGLAMLETMDSTIRGTVLYKSDWHKGVVGIVASRMIERKYQPTIVLTESNDKISGSARSIPGLNLFEALSECQVYLETFGGHYFAAGLTLKKENLEAFQIKFNEVVKKYLVNEEDFQPSIAIDVVIDFDSITAPYYNLIEQMQPYGPENLRPIFCTKNVYNYQNKSTIVKEKHLKFILEKNGHIAKGIGFNMAHFYPIICSGKPFDICYTLDINIWNGVSNVELKLVDVKYSI